jgi:hypothetical protein
MSDGIVYETARQQGAELQTSEDNLKGLKGVVFV